MFVDERLVRNADEVRASLVRGPHDTHAFRAALLNVPLLDRDAWVDAVFGLDEPFEDGPHLPQGCVPYLPCAVDALLRMTEQLPILATDVFVDIGAGVGRAAVLVHLLTGASILGIEVQPEHVLAAQNLVQRLRLSRVTFQQGDAVNVLSQSSSGTVFFLYCPFGGQRLEACLAQLADLARVKAIAVCSVDLPLPSCSWLERVGPDAGDLAMYRTQSIAQ